MDLAILNTNTQTKETQSQITPSIALDMLKEGNARFMANKQAGRDLLK